MSMSIENDDIFYPVIEFINGKTLYDIELNKNYSDAEIFKIILQLSTVFKYLHDDHFIYRDLKPNNAIIDQNKNIVLIDFDRMIKDESNNETIDLASPFGSPELNSNHITNKVDISSLGQMINFILDKSNSKIHNNPEFQKILQKLTNINANDRFSAAELIINLIKFAIDNHIELNDNDPEIIYAKSIVYMFSKNINEAIDNYTLTSSKNCAFKYYNLGLIFFEGKLVSRNIHKSMHFFNIALNLNYKGAQYIFGLLFYDGKYVSRDINKSIYYYSLAANQNYPQAQYNLGLIYYEGKYISQDINKAIFYFQQASDNNYLDAQYNLGLIYEQNKYGKRDINKAIHYFSLAAKRNHTYAQFKLGLIYYEEKYGKRDINKAIYYLTLASEKNISIAQYI